MPPARQVINVQWVSDFLQYIIDQNRSFIILIVCAARESFLEQLLATVNLQSREPYSHHQLLTKSLGTLSRARNVRTVFCPTIEHLRAYLSTGIEGRLPLAEDKQNPQPLLAILNPLSLHLPTREFSAQGLSRTLASAVEVSSRTNMDVVLCECRDALDASQTEHGEALWYMDVPLLNNSLRSGTEGNSWTGRTVPIKRVAQRWFPFTDSSIREDHIITS
ncbi:hypothetical protein BJY04DRAFT_4589 [Aspergillus karnatakaensis]|uniref:uncharacterized protein n=1 Tax=Aspergillus karnatakaensis TaxID=1810916 RepID=UPI003CCDC039